MLTQLAAKERRGKVARMLSCLFHFFGIMYYIPHNYVIPQAMPHAIPQTHFVFYPDRSPQSE